MSSPKGFTLIELMIVISIIGILAAIAIPNFISYRDKSFLVEGYELADPVRKNIIEFYDTTGRMPKDNLQCGIAAPELIAGKYVESILVNNGTIVILFNEDARTYANSTITMTPTINESNPTSPIIWVAETEVAEKMLKKRKKRKMKKSEDSSPGQDTQQQPAT